MAQVLFPGARFTDTNGDPIDGGKLYLYQAGTTTPLDAYTDSALTTPAANPVELDSSGLVPVRYMSPDNYKFVLKSSDDTTTYWSIDNITIVASTASSVALRSAENKTSSFNVTSSDNGKLFTCNTSGGSITATAEAGTLGNGFWFTCQKTSASNSLIVSPDAGETINGASTYTMSAVYETATFVSLGASGWAVAASSTLDTISASRILGRAVGAGSGAIQQLTGTQATAILNAFTSSLKGLVPAPAGGDNVKALLGDADFHLAEDIDATKSLGADGYVKLPGGVILQWGDFTSSPSGGSTTVSLPISFPSACVFAGGQGIYPSATGDGGVPRLRSKSTSSLSFATDNSGSYIWFAVGY